MLRKIRGRRIEHATNPAIEREFAAADRIDGDAGRIRGIFDRKFDVELHWHVAEEAAFHANKRDFVIELPGNVIAWTDVNVFVGQTLVHRGLNGLGLGSFLRAETGPAQHVEEIGVAAGVELVSALNLHATFAEKIHNRSMQHRGTELRFYIVPDDREIFVGKTFGPGRITGDENRDVVDETDPGFERAARVKFRSFLGTDREIIDHDLGRGIFELGNDLFAGGFFFQGQKCAERIVFRHVIGEAVHDHAHFHDGAGEGHLVAENPGAIRGRKNGFADVEPDFSPVDIEGSDNFDVAGAIGADLLVHEADRGAVGRGMSVKIDALDERAGTVAHSNDGDSYFSHGKGQSYPQAQATGKMQCSRFTALRLRWSVEREVSP